MECRLFSEYLGLDTILAVVCKTYDGVKALETYDKEGCILKSSGLHGLAASIGKNMDGRFNVICLENLRHESLCCFFNDMDVNFLMLCKCIICVFVLQTFCR